MRLALLFGVLAFINSCQEESEPQGQICYFGDNCMQPRMTEILAAKPATPRTTIELISLPDTYYYYINTTGEVLDSECNVVCNLGSDVATRTNLYSTCDVLVGETGRSVVWQDQR